MTLRRRMAAQENELEHQRDIIAVLRKRLASAHLRDPKTGRILPKGK